MYTLIGICNCCGEPNVILKTESQGEIDAKVESINKDIAEFEKENALEDLYKSMKIENHTEIFKAMKDLEKKGEIIKEAVDKDPSKKAMGDLGATVIDIVITVFKESLKDAPKYYGLQLHVV